MNSRYFACIFPAAIIIATPACADTTLESAQKLVEDYYSAINSHDYKTAFNLWEKDEAGKLPTGQNYKKFAQGFKKTKSVNVKILNIEPIDAGMGHVFTTVNVQISATDNKGKTKNFGGYYNLRARSNTFAPTNWKIMTSQIREY
jgi:hypothetical protein